MYSNQVKMVIVSIGWLSVAIGCIDRQPAPVCPIPTEIAIHETMANSFDGVDMLVVVDNSGSMDQEQEILATGFYTLVNSLVEPIVGKDWPYPEVQNVRIAVVTTNMGLQYGEDGSTEGFPYGEKVLDKCTNRPSKGDDGEFQTSMAGGVPVESGKIRCEPDGGQCPVDWSCGDEGTCLSPSGEKESINCEQLVGEAIWADTQKHEKNTSLASQVACLSQLGTGGCGVEQQLEASVRALSGKKSQRSFIRENHLLVVLIVSDEEDCSIKDKGLFFTPEWNSNTGENGSLNTACNLPASNEEDYLFETGRYWNKLVELKNEEARAVIFAAIVGVPNGKDSPCQGTGDQLRECLEDPDMELKVGVFENEDEVKYKHFSPACVRRAQVKDENGVEHEKEVTSARPGRRYVKVAQEFGERGYVYSICNADWSPAMKEIAEVIAENMQPQCYPKSLQWDILDIEEQQKSDCENCGVAKCDAVVTFEYPLGEEKDCPAEFDVPPEKQIEEKKRDLAGNPTHMLVHCPLPKLPAPIDCDAAKEKYAQDQSVGWFYCENQNEDFDETCGDLTDNDRDTKTDCEDDGCADCTACGGTGIDCERSCKYGVELTEEAKAAVQGKKLSVQCLQQFSFENENCQENTWESCTDGEDNDGNGIWDCDEVLEGAEAHFADPHCCPMTKAEDGVCKIAPRAFISCPTMTKDHPSAACYAHAEILACDLP